MPCCGKAAPGRIIAVKDGQYPSNFKYFTTQQLVKRGVYTYCYKCQKYHTKEEYEACNKVEEKKE